MKIKLKHTYFILLIILFLPYLQEKCMLFKLEPLTGAINTPEQVQFRGKEWFDAIYQQKKDEENNVYRMVDNIKPLDLHNFLHFSV